MSLLKQTKSRRSKATACCQGYVYIWASCVKSNVRPLSSAAEASLYRREAGEREKEGARARGGGRGMMGYCYFYSSVCGETPNCHRLLALK